MIENQKLLEETIINHPDGIVNLLEVQLDVITWNNNTFNTSIFGFTSRTVQALIDKIVELQKDLIYNNIKHEI